jgi:hypothetical protein
MKMKKDPDSGKIDLQDALMDPDRKLKKTLNDSV